MAEAQSQTQSPRTSTTFKDMTPKQKPFFVLKVTGWIISGGMI